MKIPAATDQRTPTRVLHVLNRMNRAGVETWLMHVMRNIDRKRFQMDFLVQTTEQSAYDQEIRSLGGAIIPCLSPHDPVKFAARFISVLRKRQYDVIHSHMHNYSGYILFLAACSGVKKRIAHSHLDTGDLDRSATPARRLYLTSSRQLIRTYATCGLAASKRAAVSLFGEGCERDQRWRILLYGSDLSAFEQQVNVECVRRCLGIPENAIVIGHVGRFMPQKNHEFLLRVAKEICTRERNAWFLLVGDGPLKPDMERKAVEAGLAEKFVFCGVRSDIPELVKAMDVFVFPSLYEGLGLVLIEAQAAGVPCVYSDVILEEADVIPSLVQRLPLEAGPEVWANFALAHARALRTVVPSEAVRIVAQSPFNITRTVHEIEGIYSGERLQT